MIMRILVCYYLLHYEETLVSYIYLVYNVATKQRYVLDTHTGT